uniref:Uncharacterized protein n=1 Tax=Lactuca sativa TaxID=4236 RepID=A0A9R1VRK6_LACSA|nr:hypothetical protein LSAT_V11C400218470 [Lactuca sativa]
MFRTSCCGAFVNILMGVEFHNLLCIYLLCKEVSTYSWVDLEELLFSIHNYRVFFGNRALCHVIDLQGNISWYKEYPNKDFVSDILDVRLRINIFHPSLIWMSLTVIK